MNGIFTQPPFCIICCQAYLAHVNCAQSMQGRLDQVLSTEMCMNVFACVQIVFKMQVSIIHPTFDTLCCLLLHSVGGLEHVVAHLIRAEENVALWTQTNKLLHRHRIQFVLEESDYLAIHIAIEGMVEGVLTEIRESQQHPPYLYRYLLSGHHRPNYPYLRTAVATGRDVGTLRTCDSNESYRCAALANRARKSPQCKSCYSALYSSQIFSNRVASREIRFDTPFA